MMPDARAEPPPHHRSIGERRLRLLSEHLFRSVLIRERRRAERSDRSLVLVLVRPTHGTCWEGLAERLASAKDATDVMGWYEEGATIGIVRTLSSTPKVTRLNDGSTLCIEGALAKRLAAEAAEGFSVRTCVHPQPWRPAADGIQPFNPELYPEHTWRQPRTRIHDALKRGLDVIGSLLSLGLLSPVVLVIAVLVKFSSPGPAFFRQTRVGHKMKPFTLLKFRTMYVQADPAVHQEYVSWFITTAGGADGLPSNGLYKLTHDPRITPIGRFLRRTSLDELPQLWNVLRGDMSLVGPRPPLPYELAQYRPWHRRRVVDAKPGLTGLWQVTGRSRTTFDEMVRLDLRYAQRRSLRFDVAILGRTPAAVIFGKGAC